MPSPRARIAPESFSGARWVNLPARIKTSAPQPRVLLAAETFRKKQGIPLFFVQESILAEWFCQTRRFATMANPWLWHMAEPLKGFLPFCAKPKSRDLAKSILPNSAKARSVMRLDAAIGLFGRFVRGHRQSFAAAECNFCQSPGFR
jgi:hypothetical protein